MTDQQTHTILFNGTELTVAVGASLQEVLAQQGVASDQAGLAVAVNRQVAPKATWADHSLQPGDAVDVVQAFAGG